MMGSTAEEPDEMLTISNNETRNYTDDEVYMHLEKLQEKATLIMIPSMIYLIILSIVGFIGNSLVIFVYSQKFKRTPTRIFILSIASFDLITNVVAIPGEIYDMFHLWDFDKPHVCKIRLFFNAFTTMVAAMVLVAVAVTRYRKICRPFKWQINVTHAKILSVSLALASLLFSIPYAVINGRQTKPTPTPGIHGYECTIDDAYRDTKWPLMNAAFFIFLFIVCSTPLIVLYILIGIQAWKHRHMHGTGKAKADNSSDKESSSEVSSKSTKESRGSLPVVGSRSRSFVRKDSGNPENVVKKQSNPESGTPKSTNHAKLEDRSNNNKVSKSRCVIESGDVRSSNESGNVIASMFRELTVKLKSAPPDEQEKKCHHKTSVTFNEVVESFAEPICQRELSCEEDQPMSTNDTTESPNRSQTDVDDEEKSLQEARSDFAKAMQWIDLTYCKPTTENSGDQTDFDSASGSGLLSKKNSIISFRKISRDNSFQRKSRKFKDVVNDTLVRARKSAKDREAAKNDIQKVAILEDVHDGGKLCVEDGDMGAEHFKPTQEESKSSAISAEVTPTSRKVSEITIPDNRRPSVKETRRARGVSRTTVMLIIISLIYVLGFLPYLALAFFKNLAPDSYESMSDFGESLYNLFLRSYFLNCAANPIIYNLCDINFRKECIKLLRIFTNSK
ncbi:uncharacterized protein LOC106058287 [Biomphalaria glabrata]|uniref:Uncharacterized protein LOC106058287 n=1 Tax=Biomphalaria glabrata TaxID=6526 RepID=A0A9W2ZAA0_BIOGL|nr:uncharacterized protein LOC106058287 [Biomphalaria glabrata]XP_055871820.1 uncharacterized protein LOC106058287 [Biomphalaria glabrata]